MASLAHIATIANDRSVYQSMRASMDRVGYTGDRFRFTLLDNSESNRHDPYDVLRRLATDGDEPYVILCHQDLLFDESTSADRLQRAIEELNRRDDRWAVAGTAGADRFGKLLLHLDDPGGRFRTTDLPRPVVTLDENFLLIRRARYPMPSADLSGFHQYGTDLCVNAFLDRSTTYLIDFPVKHLSGGDSKSDAYNGGLERLKTSLKKRLLFGRIITPCCDFKVWSGGWVSRTFMRAKVTLFLVRIGVPYVARYPRWGR